jgi:choline dehydrogenase-like flavoprotein
MQSLALEFGALGMGRMILHVEDDGLWPQAVNGGSHHMGTTRMSDDPKQGVVDRHCRVHGMENLYVAGSSVFPTSGSANPTLTLVALALRLAGHLKERFQ